MKSCEKQQNYQVISVIRDYKDNLMLFSIYEIRCSSLNGEGVNDASGFHNDMDDASYYCAKVA